MLKGRSNYACLHRIRDGVPDDQGTLVDLPEGSLGSEVLGCASGPSRSPRRAASATATRAPSHTDKIWQQVSVNHRECLGATKCPYAVECFAERAREHAMQSKLIVTNHSLLAIDAIEGVPMIPEYDVVVVDEAHELVVAGHPGGHRRALESRRSSEPRVGRATSVDGSEADDMSDAGDALRAAIDDLTPGRIDDLPDELADALALLRVAAPRARSPASRRSRRVGEADAARQQARGMVDEIRKVAERLAAHSEHDVIWLAERDRSRGGNQLCVAPLQVVGPAPRPAADREDRGLHVRDAQARRRLHRGRVLDRAQADRAGRPLDRRPGRHLAEAAVPIDAESRSRRAATTRSRCRGEASTSARRSTIRSRRSSTSPSTCPPPGRDGLGTAQIDEIGGLLEAAGGRTLGLFSSRRAAEAASEALRERLPHMPILCQGDGQLSHLQAEFVANPAVSLFGTLRCGRASTCPGDTCQLVIIDRVPFPRPDDPLMSARARAAERAGGNGFMAVSATHAALLLAQGTGRLIRTQSDRGVVAILDPRVATARYGGFLRASLPPMWTTYDPAVARNALARLAQG